MIFDCIEFNEKEDQASVRKISMARDRFGRILTIIHSTKVGLSLLHVKHLLLDHTHHLSHSAKSIISTPTSSTRIIFPIFPCEFPFNWKKFLFSVKLLFAFLMDKLFYISALSFQAMPA